MQPFPALKHPGFRIYWSAQMVSLIGTWMQNMAQGWLVLDLTGSPFLLGLVSAAQFTPMLCFSLIAGAVADRLDKKRIIFLTQLSMMFLALILGILVLNHRVRYWHVVVFAFLLGTATTFDNPTRQSFVVEMVGKRDLMNAVALNSAIFNGARIVGPAIAGLIIARFGIGVCYLINAASFLGILLVLTFIRPPYRTPLAQNSSNTSGLVREIKEGLYYIRHDKRVLYPIILMAGLSLFAINFSVLIPVLARKTLHLTAQGYGYLMTSMGAGTLIGAVMMALQSYRGPRRRYLVGGATGLCIFQIALWAGGQYLIVSMVLLFLSGFSMIVFATSVNTTIQINVPDNLRGRVMSVYSLVFTGVTPLGSLFSGTIANLFNAPVSFALGGILGLFCMGAILVPLTDIKEKTRKRLMG